ncbi:uncharacterized protein M421DRAFT_74771, partial [Didymella exigua CBS 183.55]
FELVEHTKLKYGILDKDVYNFDKAGFIYTGRLIDNAHLTPHIGYIVRIKSMPIRLTADERKPGKVTQEEGAPKLRGDAVPLSFEIPVKLLAFAGMRIVPTLTDAVIILIGCKVIAESYVPILLICSAINHTPRRGKLMSFLYSFIADAGNRDDFARPQRLCFATLSFQHGGRSAGWPSISCTKD